MGGTTKASMVREDKERTRTALASGGWRYNSTDTDYNGDGLPTQVNDLGDQATADDDSCVRTTYARDTTRWMLSYAVRVETVTKACTATPRPPRRRDLRRPQVLRRQGIRRGTVQGRRHQDREARLLERRPPSTSPQARPPSTSTAAPWWSPIPTGPPPGRPTPRPPAWSPPSRRPTPSATSPPPRSSPPGAWPQRPPTPTASAPTWPTTRSAG
ncbi:hypothetical protein [Nonomuraea salmonea]|uniref:hypothetical protein n=1 Tax=Nonomuraea salmonea TaxID=46181 RepID=UPI0031EB83C0